MAHKLDTRQRSDIPAEYRWDFTAIFPGWDAWQGALTALEAQMDAFAALQGTLAQGPDGLLAAYRAQDEIGQMQYRVYRFPQLQRDVDTRDQAVAGRLQRVNAVFARFDTATAWFTPELLRIPEAQVKQ
ncbi:MAG: oligoendopeptidase F, partial [Rubrivivax sp.]|nr:oligoendopeptidase F [Rubrivivax sp.]